MQTVTKWYTGLVVTLGMSLGVLVAVRFFLRRAGTWTPDSLFTFLALAFLCWVCCCLPLYIQENCTVDLSFLSVLASVLVMGPEVAIVINMITYPFVVISSYDGKDLRHSLNTPIYKTLLNISNHNLSYLIGGIAYRALGGNPGNISLPHILPPAFAFICLAITTNVLVISLYFSAERISRFYSTVFQLIWGLIPSIALSAPIGYFMAVLLQMESGVWLAMLFMLPLLLARYSFKLYLDTRHHQAHLVKALMAALETKDTYTEGHSQRVEHYAGLIAQRMSLPAKRKQNLQLAAIFHDIGKIGVPDAILQKPGALTPEERAEIQKHPESGVRILENLEGYEEIIPMVLHHHECYDGKGYPRGTQQDDLPLDVYILGAADAFDAITSDRPYRKGRPPQEAAAILLREAGSQFHPEVARAVAGMVSDGLLDRPDVEV